jgi:hypothetical protein
MRRTSVVLRAVVTVGLASSLTACTLVGSFPRMEPDEILVDEGSFGWIGDIHWSPDGAAWASSPRRAACMPSDRRTE